MGEFDAKRRQCKFSSGMMNSSSLFGDRPLGVVCRAAEGTDSSRMDPRSVFIWGEPFSVTSMGPTDFRRKLGGEEKRGLTSVVRKMILQLY